MKKIVIILILTYLCLSNYSKAQNVYSFEKGYIIKKTGDTISCLVPVSIHYGTEIKYKFDENSPEKSIKSYDIKYLLTPYNAYENVLVDNEEKLMRIILIGKIKLYSYIIPDEGYNPNGGFYMYGPPNIEYTLEKDSSLYTFTKKNYEKTLKEQLKECTEIVAKIGKKGYKFDDIEKILSDYNDCVK